MGTNFHAIIDHRLSQPEIAKLDVLLHAEWKIPSSPLAAVPAMPGRTAWEWDLLPASPSPEYELDAHGFLEFNAPVDINGTAFIHALDLGSAIRWGTFLDDADTQRILCRAVRQIAKIVKGYAIIFLPDSISSGVTSDLLHEGKNIESVHVSLSQTYGSPAPSLALLREAWFKGDESYQYFVEYTNGAG